LRRPIRPRGAQVREEGDPGTTRV